MFFTAITQKWFLWFFTYRKNIDFAKCYNIKSVPNKDQYLLLLYFLEKCSNQLAKK